MSLGREISRRTVQRTSQIEATKPNTRLVTVLTVNPDGTVDVQWGTTITRSVPVVLTEGKGGKHRLKSGMVVTAGFLSRDPSQMFVLASSGGSVAVSTPVVPTPEIIPGALSVWHQPEFTGHLVPYVTDGTVGTIDILETSWGATHIFPGSQTHRPIGRAMIQTVKFGTCFAVAFYLRGQDPEGVKVVAFQTGDSSGKVAWETPVIQGNWDTFSQPLWGLYFLPGRSQLLLLGPPNSGDPDVDNRFWFLKADDGTLVEEHSMGSDFDWSKGVVLSGDYLIPYHDDFRVLSTEGEPEFTIFKKGSGVDPYVVSMTVPLGGSGVEAWDGVPYVSNLGGLGTYKGCATNRITGLFPVHTGSSENPFTYVIVQSSVGLTSITSPGPCSGLGRVTESTLWKVDLETGTPTKLWTKVDAWGPYDPAEGWSALGTNAFQQGFITTPHPTSPVSADPRFPVLMDPEGVGWFVWWTQASEPYPWDLINEEGGGYLWPPGMGPNNQMRRRAYLVRVGPEGSVVETKLRDLYELYGFEWRVPRLFPSRSGVLVIGSDPEGKKIESRDRTGWVQWSRTIEVSQTARVLGAGTTEENEWVFLDFFLGDLRQVRIRTGEILRTVSPRGMETGVLGASFLYDTVWKGSGWGVQRWG